ncbi:hypothetical protein BLNAU_10233 [Blattamonas nauphoetae]|uniref:Uncharacterized protein n=1 Tax=Blattamonas nauphoetae TaxID=2049346 RepID=A0ABQ9XTD6_9EUKA|nr:hypothetical protein BLNAU_10233 [Blattamonas nauphoetae]
MNGDSNFTIPLNRFGSFNNEEETDHLHSLISLRTNHRDARNFREFATVNGQNQTGTVSELQLESEKDLTELFSTFQHSSGEQQHEALKLMKKILSSENAPTNLFVRLGGIDQMVNYLQTPQQSHVILWTLWILTNVAATGNYAKDVVVSGGLPTFIMHTQSPFPDISEQAWWLLRNCINDSTDISECIPRNEFFAAVRHHLLRVLSPEICQIPTQMKRQELHFQTWEPSIIECFICLSGYLRTIPQLNDVLDLLPILLKFLPSHNKEILVHLLTVIGFILDHSSVEEKRAILTQTVEFSQNGHPDSFFSALLLLTIEHRDSFQIEVENTYLLTHILRRNLAAYHTHSVELSDLSEQDQTECQKLYESLDLAGNCLTRLITIFGYLFALEESDVTILIQTPVLQIIISIFSVLISTNNSIEMNSKAEDLYRQFVSEIGSSQLSPRFVNLRVLHHASDYHDPNPVPYPPVPNHFEKYYTVMVKWIPAMMRNIDRYSQHIFGHIFFTLGNLTTNSSKIKESLFIDTFPERDNDGVFFVFLSQIIPYLGPKTFHNVVVFLFNTCFDPKYALLLVDNYTIPQLVSHFKLKRSSSKPNYCSLQNEILFIPLLQSILQACETEYKQQVMNGEITGLPGYHEDGHFQGNQFLPQLQDADIIGIVRNISSNDFTQRNRADTFLSLVEASSGYKEIKENPDRNLPPVTLPSFYHLSLDELPTSYRLDSGDFP